MPNYVRGKCGRIETVIKPKAINNEDEGFGRNAGQKRRRPLTPPYFGVSAGKVAPGLV